MLTLVALAPSNNSATQFWQHLKQKHIMYIAEKLKLFTKFSTVESIHYHVPYVTMSILKPHGTSMPYIDTTKIVTLISHVIAYIMLHLPFWI